MKTRFWFTKCLDEMATSEGWQRVLTILSRMKAQKKMLLIGVLLFPIFTASFSQETTVLLSQYDSCHVQPPEQAIEPFAIEAVTSPLVRVAYVIPSNRTPQPDGVVNLQNAIRLGQQYYKEQMEQNGFGAKTFALETEADGVTPLVHVVHVTETDDFLRGDIWGRTTQAAINAGMSVWASGELWVLIPEAHLMLPDGTVTGGAALGASNGTGNSPGVAMIGSNALPLFHPAMLTDDTPYNGKILPALGPFPMKQDVTFAWFEGTTFSSIASSWLGALWHEMGHAFGLAHDFRNDNNFHGNLMGNGLRGTRGSLFPERYPQDYTRLEYASALILNVNHYFNTDKSVTSSPVISYTDPVSVVPQRGLVNIAFQASDNDLLSLAHLRYDGNTVAEIALEGNIADVTFAVPYFTKVVTNAYTIAVHDMQGNTTYRSVQFNVPGGYNQAPTPFIQLDPPVPGENQAITLNGSGSYDADHDPSSLLAAWDVDNDGEFDTEPSTNKTVQYRYESPGNYLIRLKLTDPDGAETISTPVSIKIPGEQKIAIESFTLINADKDEAVADLKGGMVIELAVWERKRFSVRANTSAGMIDRVEFDLKGPISHQQVDKRAPYTLFGDSPKGNVIGRRLLPGEYTLTATPYFSLEKGIALTVSFNVTEGSVPGQPTILWDKTIGGAGYDYLFGGAISTPDGGYLLAGQSSSDASGDKSENARGPNNFSDYWIVKIDEQRNKLWDKTYGGENIEELRRVISAPDGGYLLAGFSYSGLSGDKSEHSRGGFDYWVVKIDNLGNKVWDKTFGGGGFDVLFEATSSPDGGYLLGGFSDSNTSGDKSDNGKGDRDYWVVRIDSQGNKVWDKTFGGVGGDELHSTIATPDGGWLLAGASGSNISVDKSENSKGSTDYWIIKIDKAGNKVWDKTIGGDGTESLANAILTPDGGYLLSGSSTSNASGDKSEDGRGNWDSWVVKLDGTGNKIWDKTFGGEETDGITKAMATPDGGFLLAGGSNSNASGDKSEDGMGNWDFWIVKIDAAGNKLWDKTIGGSDADELSTVTRIADGSYLLAGSSNSNADGDKSENRKGESDYWIVSLKGPSTPAVTSLTLMNADTDQEIKELKDGDVISLAELGVRLLNIRANISGEKIDKVAFDLNGPTAHRQNDKIYPYSLYGDHLGDFEGRELLPGDYVLTVTPYVNNRTAKPLVGGGSVTPHTIAFTVIGGEATETEDLQVEVFPVPASGVVNIRYKGKTELSHMILLDPRGNVLFRRPLSQQPVEQLDISAFRKGIHYLKVISPEGEQIIRLVVE